jgi:predicted RNase H-like nuclease
MMLNSRTLVGVDGCRGGWLVVVHAASRLDTRVFADWPALITGVPTGALVGVDIPIGLPATGSRRCDLEARQRLKPPRGSSVFPAPVRECLREGTYSELSDSHRRIDGRGLTRQAYFLLPKIRQVDQYVMADPSRQRRIHEVHPEVSFALWNRGAPMAHNKSKPAGRAERERLIDAVWPGERERLWAAVRGRGCGRDDLNDALAALWTVRRIAAGDAVRMPQESELDERGVRMEITA